MYRDDLANKINENIGAIDCYWREHPEKAHYHRLIALLAEGFAIDCQAMRAHYPCLDQAINVFSMLHAIQLVDPHILDDLYNNLKPYLVKIYPQQYFDRAESREYPPPGQSLDGGETG